MAMWYSMNLSSLTHVSKHRYRPEWSLSVSPLKMYYGITLESFGGLAQERTTQIDACKPTSPDSRGIVAFHCTVHGILLIPLYSLKDLACNLSF